MKPERVATVALLLLAMMNSGCAGVDRKTPALSPISGPERSLNEALGQLRAGNEKQAYDLLEKVADGDPKAGVTDEALFRLALLSLGEGRGKGVHQAQALLERLAGTYPDSLWTRQSAPLLAHLEEVRSLRNRQRELKTMKELNLSLSRDNRELRLSLERLKQLDLELEQRIKR